MYRQNYLGSKEKGETVGPTEQLPLGRRGKGVLERLTHGKTPGYVRKVGEMGK